jgi:hypothetical protein
MNLCATIATIATKDYFITVRKNKSLIVELW